MSPLELTTHVNGDHDLWIDTAGTRWLSVWIGPQPWLWVVHRVSAAAAERLACAGEGWVAQLAADVRQRCLAVPHAERDCWLDARYGHSVRPGPDVGDRMARLAIGGPAAKEQALLGAISRQEPGARAVYADWLLSQGRTREAEALGFPTLAIGQATRPAYHVPRRWQLGHNAWPMRFMGPGFEQGSIEQQPRAGGPLQWMWSDGVPAELVIAPPRGEVGLESAFEAVLEALADERVIAPWMRALRVVCPPPPTWPWGLEAMLDKLAGQGWIERLTVVASPASPADVDLSLLAELPALRSLTVVGLPSQLRLSPLLERLEGLRELRAPHWGPSADDLARLAELGVERLQVDRAPAGALAELGLRELALACPAGDLGALGDQLTTLELGFGGAWRDRDALGFTRLAGLRSLSLWGLSDAELELPRRLKRLVLADSSVEVSGEAEELHVDAIDVAVDHLERGLSGVTRLALGGRRAPVRLATSGADGATALERLPSGLRRLSLTGAYLHRRAARSLRRYQRLEMLELVDCRYDAHIELDLPPLDHVALWGSPDADALAELAQQLQSLRKTRPELLVTAAYEVTR